MEEEKKKSSVGLIVFLVILVLSLGGYVCYDKFLKTKDSVQKDVDVPKKENDEINLICLSIHLKN